MGSSCSTKSESSCTSNCTIVRSAQFACASKAWKIWTGWASTLWASSSLQLSFRAIPTCRWISASRCRISENPANVISRMARFYAQLALVIKYSTLHLVANQWWAIGWEIDWKIILDTFVCWEYTVGSVAHTAKNLMCLSELTCPVTTGAKKSSTWSSSMLLRPWR